MKRRSFTFADDIVKAIDEYRAKKRPIPNFTEAINDILRGALGIEKNRRK